MQTYGCKVHGNRTIASQSWLNMNTTKETESSHYDDHVIFNRHVINKSVIEHGTTITIFLKNTESLNKKSTYECQLRFIIPTTRPDGRDETAFVSPAEPCTRIAVLGASSALLGTR